MVKERRKKNTTKKEDVEWPILAEEIKDLKRKKKERYIVYIDSQTTSERKFGTHVSFKNHKGGRKKEKKEESIRVRAYCVLGYLHGDEDCWQCAPHHLTRPIYRTSAIKCGGSGALFVRYT